MKAEAFLEVSAGKCQDIMSQLDTRRVGEKEENRATIRPIIETILFCVEQELPLIGDCDSLRANSGDEDLRRHVISSRKNATYMSPDIQNEIIQICSEIVTEEIMKKINRASCFTLLADETMDVSGTEQFSICIRYIDLVKDSQTPIISEDLRPVF
ncbi:hypothetical protein ILUMI_24963 [Ignelater luminosus]|uniref:DUF4371 domain-containing protein n=1 Tax=Ignelater luminosus TaxID=2038154 RepID=A0A8K0C5F4_IGNLU|nr:hypothetical protein ILUMI_24963 [Ignelater luminosus]